MTNTSYIIPSAGQDLFFDGSHHRNHYSSYNSFNHSNFNNNYGYNSNSNSINKFGDIKTRGINGTSQSENAHLNYPFGDENFGQINVGQPNQRRVRHFSQQQSPMIWQQQNGQSDKESKFKSDLKESNQKIINGKTPNDDLSLINSFKFENNKTIHEKENQKKDFKPEIDVTIPIGSYEPEYHLLYLIKKIESTLKKAKENKTLPCTEILSPQQLIHQIAQDIIGMAESEPCGIRGCVLYINLEEKSICRRIGEVKLGDQSTVATFEMYLTLKRASSSWLDAVESKLFGKESVVLSELYKLSKKKLFRSLSSP